MALILKAKVRRQLFGEPSKKDAAASRPRLNGHIHQPTLPTSCLGLGVPFDDALLLLLLLPLWVFLVGLVFTGGLLMAPLPFALRTEHVHPSLSPYVLKMCTHPFRPTY